MNNCFSQEISDKFESESIFGIEEPEELKNILNDSNDSKIDTNNITILRPEKGYGELHVVIESINALNSRVISKKADRAEIWLGHLLLARLDLDDVKVKDVNSSRIFDFPIITLKSGYYFISIRLYSKGFMWKNRKFHEEIFQVGVHEDRRTNLRRKIPFLNW